ncbi:MAG: tryptophan 7-halogenase [Pirellulales bacterium]|nr:tryptophan 7-halogenase [Pirellulales bacterium]
MVERAPDAATLPEETEVIVVGGGPAGTTAATIAAQQGRCVMLFERDRFPRFHVGESLIPETFWTLKRLGMVERLSGSQFVEKHSVQFVNEKGFLSAPFYFVDHRDDESSQTWQVRRDEFDEMMLRNAESHGVKVHEGMRVLEVLFDGTRATGVRVADESGNISTIASKVVVDASGQAAMVTSRLGLREWDPVLKKAAVWSYWKGAARGTGRDEGATLVMQLDEKQGWLWYIPLNDDVVSIGVVAGYDYLFQDRESKVPETVYATELERRPGLNGRLDNAVQVEPVRVAKEYSYRARDVAGDGWVLVGDAFGFLDPLYSSGILLALKSGELAGDAVVSALEKNDLSADRLGCWGEDYVRGMDRMRRLVYEFYDGFNFGKFVKRFPHLRGHVTDLLIGDLFNERLDEIVEPLEILRAEQETAST